jgi:sulfatase modifying factor 1
MKRRFASLMVVMASGCQLVVGSYSSGGGDAGSPGNDGGTSADVTMTDSAGQDGAELDATDAEAGSDAEAGGDASVLDGGPDASGCVEGVQRCVGQTVETCTSSGTWGNPWLCATGMCTGGGCSGSTPGASNPSCTLGGDGLTNCGAGSESCCTSQDVIGGVYDRTYSSDDAGLSDSASVSGFRLDKYLVTVGRFRQFVEAWDLGNATPGNADGKHAHLRSGSGLVDSASAIGAYEPGWVAGDDANILSPSESELASCVITADGSTTPYSTWTTTPAGQETLPINCVNWYEAYAFCIWDGGFLPSEAELEYAAAAGSQQREYPWGPTDPGTSNEYAVYGCYYPLGSDGSCTGIGDIAPVGSIPAGAGNWGQLDLAGDVFAWALDEYAPYVDPCVDCAYLSGASTRTLRGGAFVYDEASLQPRSRDSSTPVSRNGAFGFRCARTP